MPVLKYLADTNAVSDYFRPGNPVKAWFNDHPGEIGLSTLTLAEMRRGIELKGDTKARLALERVFKFVLEDYREAILPSVRASRGAGSPPLCTSAHGKRRRCRPNDALLRG